VAASGVTKQSFGQMRSQTEFGNEEANVWKVFLDMRVRYLNFPDFHRA
jgi:hypothetical protein